MTDPVIAGRAPISADVEAGKSYFWCACGRSQNQPFCDGSHKDTGFTPVRYDAEQTRTVWFCACKQTGNQPLCDGSHNRVAADKKKDNAEDVGEEKAKQADKRKDAEEAKKEEEKADQAPFPGLVRAALWAISGGSWRVCGGRRWARPGGAGRLR